jgi:threonine/homoserine/homoserine lactone efflux protein
MIFPENSFTATMTGFVAGFLVSIPVGPINLTIINEGARRGFRWAVLIGLGAVLMETIYAALALTGFAAFLNSATVKAALQLLTFLFLLYLSWKYFRAKTIPDHSRSADMIEQKLHPHGAFMTGFVRTLGNPTILLMWVTLSATFLAHNWVDQTWDDRVGCIMGIAAGGTLWFVLLSWGVSKGHGKMSPKALLRMEHASGAILLVAALWIGVKIIHQLRDTPLPRLQRLEMRSTPTPTRVP